MRVVSSLLTVVFLSVSSLAGTLQEDIQGSWKSEKDYGFVFGTWYDSAFSIVTAEFEENKLNISINCTLRWSGTWSLEDKEKTLKVKGKTKVEFNDTGFVTKRAVVKKKTHNVSFVGRSVSKGACGIDWPKNFEVTAKISADGNELYLTNEEADLDTTLFRE
jgi:hypothetical protein